MIVLDTSVVVDLLLDVTPSSMAIRRRIRSETSEFMAPHLLDAEVGQVLRRFVLRRALAAERALGALQDLADLGLTRYPHAPLLQRAFAFRNHVTVYDGLYLALAEALGAPLLTRDQALVGVPGCRAAVETVS